MQLIMTTPTFNYIVEKHLHIPGADIIDTLSAKDIPDWDSMNYLLFIAELEKSFRVSFTGDEILGANTLGDVKKLLIRQGVRLE